MPPPPEFDVSGHPPGIDRFWRVFRNTSKTVYQLDQGLTWKLVLPYVSTQMSNQGCQGVNHCINPIATAVKDVILEWLPHWLDSTRVRRSPDSLRRDSHSAEEWEGEPTTQLARHLLVDGPTSEWVAGRLNTCNCCKSSRPVSREPDA